MFSCYIAEDYFISKAIFNRLVTDCYRYVELMGYHIVALEHFELLLYLGNPNFHREVVWTILSYLKGCIDFSKFKFFFYNLKLLCHTYMYLLFLVSG